ncbi:MAG: xylulokinase [Pseudomonadota bacterium]
MSLTLGIDLGTSGIKAAILEDAARVLASAAHPVAVSIPQMGWSEQDPDLWVSTVWACLDDLAASHPAEMAAVTGIGLSGQMLACLILDGDLRPLRPAMLWNDQRAIAECADLSARVPDIGNRTNGTPDPGITAPKLLWLAKNEPRVLAQAKMLMLTKDYVRLALTGEVACDPTDAGGTQLFDCRAGSWDPKLCQALNWDPAHLPPILNPWDAAGALRPALARRWGMRATLPVATGCGDNMGSSLGAGAATPGDAVLTIGTSGVACLVDAKFSPGPQSAILTSAHAAPNAYLSMGVVMAATAALDWTARLTGMTPAALVAAATDLSPAQRADAPIFLPALNGIRTPLNRPDAMGRMDGLHPGVTPASLGYALLEGVAFQFADCIAAQRAVGVTPPKRFLAVGGGTRSTLWVQLLATILDHPVDLPEGSEVAGPAGAARLASVAAGAPISTLSTPRQARATIQPDPQLAALIAPRKTRFDRLTASL